MCEDEDRTGTLAGSQVVVHMRDQGQGERQGEGGSRCQYGAENVTGENVTSVVEKKQEAGLQRRALRDVANKVL